MWTARVFTLYPDLFPGPFNFKAYIKGPIDKKISGHLKVCNIRDSEQ